MRHDLLEIKDTLACDARHRINDIHTGLERRLLNAAKEIHHSDMTDRNIRETLRQSNDGCNDRDDSA